MIQDEEQARKEANALMQRLEAQFEDVGLDLKMLGLDDFDEESVDIIITKELVVEVEETEKEMDQLLSTANEIDNDNDNNNNNGTANAEAAALMARLGAQFGDLDMAQLGLGLGIAAGEAGSTSTSAAAAATSDKSDNDFEIDIESEESSLADLTPEELAAWQTSQFSNGREQRKQQQDHRKAALTMSSSTISIQQRRKILREKREQQLLEEQVRLRFQQSSSSVSDERERIASSMNSSSGSSSILDLLDGEPSAFFSSRNTKALQQLVSNETHGDPEILQTSWKRLYASYEQGLGFLSLWNALRGYNGPTLMILRTLPCASKYVAAPTKMKTTAHTKQQQQQQQRRRHSATTTACIGFYTTTPWVEKPGFFGGNVSSSNDADKAFLFSLHENQAPTTCSTDGGEDNNGESTNKNHNYDHDLGLDRVRFFPVKSKEEGASCGASGYMYCNPSTMSKRQNATNRNNKNLPVNGIGVGGKPTQPRFHLTETFEDCRCLTYDSSHTTTNGDLFANREGDDDEETNTNTNPNPFAQALYYFDVDEIEVWGVGGKEWIEQALKERESSRKQHIQRYQTIDKQMMWDEGTFTKRTASSMVSQQQP